MPPWNKLLAPSICFVVAQSAPTKGSYNEMRLSPSPSGGDFLFLLLGLDPSWHAISRVVVARVSINFCVSLSKVQAELHPIFILLFYGGINNSTSDGENELIKNQMYFCMVSVLASSQSSSISIFIRKKWYIDLF